ncbi:MAG: sodium:solute symporter family protein [Halobacteriota archaeon]
MDSLAISVFIAYLFAISVIAYFGARRTRTISDFISASGQLGFWTYCLLMIGSVFSGMTLIGVAGLGFTTGWANMWERVIGPPFAVAFGTILIGYKLYPLRKKMTILTMQDYLAHRFGDPKTLRAIAGLISAITCFVYLIGQYTAIGVVSEVVLGIPYWMGATIAAVIVISYVLAGGMFSTAWTTFLQSLLMIIGVYITVPVIVSSVGGFTALNEGLSAVPMLQTELGKDASFMFANHLDQPFAPAGVPLAGWVYNIALFGITVPLGLMVAPHVVNNVLTFKELKYTRYGPIVMYVLGVLAILLTSIAGMATRFAWADGTVDIPTLESAGMDVEWSDMAYPTMAEYALPYGVFILLLPTILAGVMSTTDRLILTASSNVSYDIVKNIYRQDISDRAIKAISRLTILVVGFGSLLIALNPQPLLAWFIWAALSLMVNCFLWPILGGIYWPRMNKHAARWCMITGFVVTMLTFATFEKTVSIMSIPFYSVVPGFIASSAVAIGLSFLLGNNKKDSE